MKKFTAEQIVLILSKDRYFGDDREIDRARHQIDRKYEELKGTPIWFPDRGPKGERNGPGAMLLPGFEYCSIESRAWWLRENVLNES